MNLDDLSIDLRDQVIATRYASKKWKSRNLAGNVDFHPVQPWKAFDRWKRGYVVDPLTFLNQERRKDTPPAAPVTLAPEG